MSKDRHALPARIGNLGDRFLVGDLYPPPLPADAPAPLLEDLMHVAPSPPPAPKRDRRRLKLKRSQV
jgi:hypothetical protein